MGRGRGTCAPPGAHENQWDGMVDGGWILINMEGCEGREEKKKLFEDSPNKMRMQMGRMRGGGISGSVALEEKQWGR